MKIGCIVMAAGNARRFGSNKLDARVEGKTLLRRALEAVPAACFDRVAVVTQYPRGMDLAREMGFLPVENPRPDLGLSHTIALGMAHMQDMDGVMFQVSDQPLLRRDSVERLVGRSAAIRTGWRPWPMTASGEIPACFRPACFRS